MWSTLSIVPRILVGFAILAGNDVDGFSAQSSSSVGAQPRSGTFTMQRQRADGRAPAVVHPATSSLSLWPGCDHRRESRRRTLHHHENRYRQSLQMFGPATCLPPLRTRRRRLDAAAAAMLSALAHCRMLYRRRVQWASLLWRRLQNAGKRSLLALSLAVLLWGGLAVTSTAPSHASSTTSWSGRLESVLERTSPNVDKIVDRYVRSHMFDDDAYDPIESLYREAYHDAATGQHPNALAEITGSILGSATGADRSKKLLAPPTSEGFATWLTSTIQKLVQRGWSEKSAILLLAGVFVIAGPSLFLFVGMIIGGISKRNIRSVMKKRYGDTYTVDATIRTEESVEAPDDDDEEEEEDDEEDEKDDDDDDDEDNE